MSSRTVTRHRTGSRPPGRTPLRQVTFRSFAAQLRERAQAEGWSTDRVLDAIDRFGQTGTISGALRARTDERETA